jgi:hypothetical protein
MMVQARGSFGKAPLVSLTGHDWPPRNYEQPFMGLVPAGQHLWGSLLVDGRRTVPIRQVQNELAVRMLLFTGEEGEDLPPTRPARVFTGFGELAERDGLWGLWEPGRDDGFGFASGGGRAFWRESGTMAVTGTELGHAIQFAIPDAEEPFAYQARYFSVGGDGGGPITGVIGHEQVYMNPGRGWFSSSYMHDLEQVWVVFVTQFTDGSITHGHLLVGRQGFNVAAVQESTGWSVTTSRLACTRIELDEGGYPECAEFEVEDGSRWSYRPSGAAGGRMPLGPDGPRWREGVVTRLGEKREIAFSHAWIEAFPGRLPDAMTTRR